MIIHDTTKCLALVVRSPKGRRHVVCHDFHRFSNWLLHGPPTSELGCMKWSMRAKFLGCLQGFHGFPCGIGLNLGIRWLLQQPRIEFGWTPTPYLIPLVMPKWNTMDMMLSLTSNSEQTWCHPPRPYFDQQREEGGEKPWGQLKQCSARV